MYIDVFKCILLSYFVFRYSYNFTENWVVGENHILKTTVALLSRNIVIQGNLTLERVKFLDACQEASAAEGRNTVWCKTQRVNTCSPCLSIRHRAVVGLLGWNFWVSIFFYNFQISLGSLSLHPFLYFQYIKETDKSQGNNLIFCSGKTCVNELNLESWNAAIFFFNPSLLLKFPPNPHNSRILSLGSSFLLIRFRGRVVFWTTYCIL